MEEYEKHLTSRDDGIGRYPPQAYKFLKIGHYILIFCIIGM